MMKVFISIAQRSMADNYAEAFKRLGVKVVSSSAATADGVMVFADHATYSIAGHARYMPKESLDILLCRDRNHETGLPVLPTTRIDKPEDAPKGAMVKPRNSGDLLQGYVWQPHLGFPIEDVDMTIAVNKAGEIMTFDEHHMTHHDYKQPGNTRPIDADALAELAPLVEAACKRLKITGGIHNVQFLKHEGKWCLVDWNPRPGISHTLGLVNHQFTDRPLAFMLGMELPPAVPVAIGTRTYWDNPFAPELEPQIRALGMIPRRHTGVIGFPRVTGAADTKKKLDNAFAKVEALR